MFIGGAAGMICAGVTLDNTKEDVWSANYTPLQIWVFEFKRSTCDQVTYPDAVGVFFGGVRILSGWGF